MRDQIESKRLILPVAETNVTLLAKGEPMRCLNCGFEYFEEVTTALRFFAAPRGEGGRPIRTEVMKFDKPILQRCVRCLMPVDEAAKERMALIAEKKELP